MAAIAVDIGKLTAQIGAGTTYGEPHDIDGDTFIPVALVWSGFGGGSDEAGAQGGGGGGASIPIGAYIKRDGVLRFEPNLIALLAVGIPFVCVAGRALRKIIRALKR